jgi:hypothetical protein
MNRMTGSHGSIKADKTGGSTTVVIASMNAWTLDMGREKFDVTAFQDANRVYVQGLPDVKGTVGGWFDSDEHALFDIAMGEIAPQLELIPTSLIPTLLWKGKGWLDSKVDVKANGAIAVSGNFVAAGPWTYVPAP